MILAQNLALNVKQEPKKALCTCKGTPPDIETLVGAYDPEGHTAWEMIEVDCAVCFGVKIYRRVYPSGETK